MFRISIFLSICSITCMAQIDFTGVRNHLIIRDAIEEKCPVTITRDTGKAFQSCKSKNNIIGQRNKNVYGFYKFPLPAFKAEYEGEIYVNPPNPRDTNVIKINNRSKVWLHRIDSFITYAMRFDSVHQYYITTDSALKLMRTDFYYAFNSSTGYSDKSFFKGPNQNKSSPEYVNSAADSLVLRTIRYRIVCKDCPYPKNQHLYYIFFYQRGGVLRHALVYLKKKRKHSKH